MPRIRRLLPLAFFGLFAIESQPAQAQMTVQGAKTVITNRGSSVVERDTIVIRRRRPWRERNPYFVAPPELRSGASRSASEHHVRAVLVPVLPNDQLVLSAAPAGHLDCLASMNPRGPSPTERSSKPRLIEAYKQGWPSLAVDAMIRSKLTSGFHQVLGQGVESFRAELDRDSSGTLLLANHSCWWDLFLVHLLNETIPLDGYGMMEHFNLLRFGFFRRIGAFSVDRTDPVSVRASLDYAVGLLRRPRAGVWIFPQGKIETNDARPLTFQPGMRAIVRRAGRVRVVPVAFRYDFWQDERPEALVRFGAPQWGRPG